MSARRIAALVGSHDPAYFARQFRPDRPSEAAVLTALRAQRSASDANNRASVSQPLTGHGRSITRHAGARAGAGTQREHVPESGGPPRIGVFAATARTRRPARHLRARVLATRPSSA